MIVVDVEATGTDGAKHSLLSVGAIDMNDLSRQFYDECRIWDGAHVDKEALVINGYSENEIRDPTKKTEGEMVKNFFAWFTDGSDQTFVGMNPTLDYDFLLEGATRNHIDFPIAKRTIDLHTVAYMHMTQRRLLLPVHNHHSNINSDFIMEYVGIPTEPKPHIALNGALWEAEALSRLFYDKPLLEEFKKYPIPWLQ